MENGPMKGNLKYKQLSLRTAPCEEFSNNILDDARREKNPP